MATINITGTGGIIEGNLGAANVNVNLDSALLFDGVNDSIDCNDVSTLDGATDITLTCWIKPVALSGTDYFLSKEVDGSNKIGIAWDSDLLYFQVADDANAYGTCAFDDATYNGVWTHLALVFDGGATGNANRLKAYINGVEQTLSFTGTIPAQTDSNSADFLMAKFSSNYYNGYMADVKIYNTNLGQTDIQTLASKINYPDILSTGTRHWWKINEGTGTAIEDHGAATDFDGTVTGATWKYDTYSVDVYNNSTTTDGTFTVTQGKVEGLALTSAEFDNATDYINLGNHNEFNFGNGSSDSPFTFAGWIRVDDATSGAIFSVYNEYAFGLNASDKLYLDLYDNADNVYERQSSTNTLTSYENEWVHVAATYSGVGGTSANAGINLYVNGVAIAMTAGDSGTYTAMHNLNSDAYIGYLYGAAGDAFDGEIGEFKIYDQELSAEQIASLYSKTLAFTPSNLYRLDEGSGTTANDTGTATTRNGTLINDTTWINGTLDLDGNLTIAANGTLSAPRGTLDCKRDFHSSGTYTHNNGTALLGPGSGSAVIQNGGSPSEPVFYNLQARRVVVYNNITVENRFDAGHGDHYCYFYSPTIVTMGTTTSQGTFDIDSATVWFHNSKLYGASSLYPAIVDATNDLLFDSTTTSFFKNIDYQGALTTNGTGHDIQLDGDCEFDAVTIASGDALDLNGQRAEFGGDFDLTTGALSMNDSLAIFKGNIDFNGRIITSNTGSTIIHDPPSVSQRLITSLYFGGNFFARGVESEVTGYHWGGSSGSGEYPAKIFVGGEFDCNDKNVKTSTNWQVATGGDLRGRSGTLTAEGDFTTSGGLIGKSGIYNNGIYNAQFAASADQNPIYGSGHNFTVEGWWKFDAFGYQVLARSANTGSWMLLNENSGANLAFSFSDFAGNTLSLSAPSWTDLGIVANTWVHIAGVCDGTSQKIYINGKLVKEGTKGAGVGNGSGMVAIGSNPNSTAYVFDGHNHMLRMWREARTVTELRANMFTTTPTDSNSKLTMNVNYVAEGSGGTITDAAGNGNGVMYKTGHVTTTDAAAWAGAGTFTRGTSKIKMTGSSKNINFAGHTNIHDFEVTGTVTLNEITGGTFEWRLFGQNFTMGSGATLSSNNNEEFVFRSGFNGGTISLADPATNIANVYRVFCNGDGALSLPELTTKTVSLDRSGGNVTATGNLTLTTELNLDNGTTFNANGNTIAVKAMDLNSGGTLDLRNSTMNFSLTTDGDNIDLASGATLLTGNTTLTGNTSSQTSAIIPSAGNFEVVGDVSHLFMLSGSDLTVVGSVSNNTFQDSTANIRQFHHTLDTQQLLDADEGGDDDLKLPRPSLDNALELQTGG
jgi:hypothetical protein